MQASAGLSAATIAPPEPSGARTRYSWNEIEKMIAHGDVKGKIVKHDLPTPALLLDLDAFEDNVRKMAAYVKSRNRALRPHGKTHKCPEIAKRLVEAGAVGACAAKLSEAEVFAAHGVRGLLITTAVIGPSKIERAIRLAKLAPDTIFSADDLQNITGLNDAAHAAKITLNIAIDLWVGGRTGIVTGGPAAALAESIQSLRNIQFVGLQAYVGNAAHVVGWEERRKVSHEAMGKAVETRRLIEKKGISCPMLTGGSTGTYNIDSELDGVTELQPGSFIFMDTDYNRIGGKDGNAEYQDFRNSLTVYTTVVSKPNENLAIVDGGLKAFSTDKPWPPRFLGGPGVSYAFGGDEHGKLTLGEGAKALKVGDKAEFIIPHCDPSVNLYDKLFCLRGDNVEAIWKIAARGMSQ